MKTYIVHLTKRPHIFAYESKKRGEAELFKEWQEAPFANLVLVKANNAETAKSRAVRFGWVTRHLGGGGKTDARADCEKMQAEYDKRFVK